MILLKRLKFQKNLIQENSMYPLFKEGEEICFKKIFFSYSPKRFDVVKIMFKKNHSEVKRIIGLPNENIKLNDNGIFIDNNLLTEKYINNKYKYADLEIKLKDNQIFVMGDNRNLSIDSRKYGSINLNDVVGILSS